MDMKFTQGNFKLNRWTLDLEKGLLNFRKKIKLTLFNLLIKAIKSFYKETSLLLCFFHFSLALWKKAGSLGLREKEFISKAKNLILNFRCMVFMDVSSKLEYYEILRLEFFTSEEIFLKFLKYFDTNIIRW